MCEISELGNVGDELMIPSNGMQWLLEQRKEMHLTYTSRVGHYCLLKEALFYAGGRVTVPVTSSNFLLSRLLPMISRMAIILG